MTNEMMTLIPIFIISIEILLILGLNKYLIQKKIMIFALVASLLLFATGLYLKNIDSLIVYKYFLIPFIGIGLLSLYQIGFKIIFKMPFHINMRSQKFPEHLKSNKSGFIEFICGLLSISTIMILMILFFKL
jgi:hypothetical protein